MLLALIQWSIEAAAPAGASAPAPASAPADRSRKELAGAEAPVCTEAPVPVEAPVHVGAPVQLKQLFNALLTELNEFKSEIWAIVTHKLVVMMFFFGP